MIKAIQLTNLCCNLIKRSLLKNRLTMANLPYEKLNTFLLQLYYAGLIKSSEITIEKYIKKLEELSIVKIIKVEDHLIDSKIEELKNHYLHYPIAHIEAINLEITYKCNSHCPHCILKAVRKTYKNEELSFEKIKSIIADAYFAGLLQNGINFTGGEALLANVDIFELIRYASSYGIPTRLFTNSFWGNKMLFKVGNHRFTSANSLIKIMKKSGLNQLALNFDSRLDKDVSGVKQLTNIIEACETFHLHYELISSTETKEQLYSFIQYVKTTLVINELKFMTPITMELVDMGGANDIADHSINHLPLKEMILHSLCKSKGFCQPNMLTIAPNGGVRSCMYGVGLSNLGNINKKSLYEIINGFDDKITMAFAYKKAFDLADLLYEPYKDLYKPFSHPCSACVLLARLIQEYSKLEKTATISNDNLLKINLMVAKDLNLLKTENSEQFSVNSE